MIKKMIVKYSIRRQSEISKDLEYEINQLISKSISAEEPVDVFSTLKKDKPDISVAPDSLPDANTFSQQKNICFLRPNLLLQTSHIRKTLYAIGFGTPKKRSNN